MLELYVDNDKGDLSIAEIKKGVNGFLFLLIKMCIVCIIILFFLFRSSPRPSEKYSKKTLEKYKKKKKLDNSDKTSLVSSEKR